MKKYLILLLLCSCLSVPAKPVAQPPDDTTEYRRQLTRDLTSMSLRIYQLEQRVQYLEAKKRKKK